LLPITKYLLELSRNSVTILFLNVSARSSLMSIWLASEAQLREGGGSEALASARPRSSFLPSATNVSSSCATV
jgi:hypothetical protein